jgi:hypothetical protein
MYWKKTLPTHINPIPRKRATYFWDGRLYKGEENTRYYSNCSGRHCGTMEKKLKCRKTGTCDEKHGALEQNRSGISFSAKCG